MSEQSGDENGLPLSLRHIICLVMFLWVLSWAGMGGIAWSSSWNTSGTIGDSFGAVNALFTGLALIGAVYAISLQTKELKATRESNVEQFKLQRDQLELQREELRLTRLEMEAQREQLERSAKAQEQSEIALKAQTEAMLAQVAALNRQAKVSEEQARITESENIRIVMVRKLEEFQSIQMQISDVCGKVSALEKNDYMNRGDFLEATNSIKEELSSHIHKFSNMKQSSSHGVPLNYGTLAVHLETILNSDCLENLGDSQSNSLIHEITWISQEIAKTIEALENKILESTQTRETQ
ncbi:MAG: cell envelope integrity protein TolA [Planctomycetota bacterium]|nr:cell envelope integrity protein TolA [Planctomycetota bacterium]